MSENRFRLPKTLWIGLACVVGIVALAFAGQWLKAASRSAAQLPVLNSVADFTLTNQDGQATTLAALTNHVWVADIIFTRCAGPCPRMTRQMASLQARLPSGSAAKLVTLTTDPDYDTPAVMKRYGERFGANFANWTFLTGTKAAIAQLAAGSLKLGATPVASADRLNDADLFIHTTVFVLVDKHTRLRGFFETGGDGVDWTNVVEPKLIGAIRQLENEP